MLLSTGCVSRAVNDGENTIALGPFLRLAAERLVSPFLWLAIQPKENHHVRSQRSCFTQLA
jgi:hypothetical protein